MLGWDTHCEKMTRIKSELTQLPGRYLAALRKHLSKDSRNDFESPLKLGHRAAALGLETPAIARMHETALIELKVSKRNSEVIKCAREFFDEAIFPITETHRVARQFRMELVRLNGALNRRTWELANTHRRLKRGILRRLEVEAALKKSGENYASLLKDSLRIQEGLRRLAHEVLAAQEEERRIISRELHNEVGQLLLGINVRLLSLKREARGNCKGLKNEIASTRRLLLDSVRSVRRIAGQFRNV
jgi:signal transduction histidine kinase